MPNTAPSAYTLYNGAGVEYIAEPGDGWNPNLPNGTQYGDDANHSYNDGWYFTLCGPGAADAAMYYWPWPSNDSTHTITDQLPGNFNDGGTHTTAALTWYGEDGSGGTQAFRLRGYMTWLAFGINNVSAWQGHKIYNYNHVQVQVTGMLSESDYEMGGPGGATLQALDALMNWEASGEQSTTYFYIVTWNGSQTEPQVAAALHNDIVTDLNSSNVPPVVEVNASDLPNWPSDGGQVNHLIAIVGYDDTWNGVGGYAYFDTCKAYTKCDGRGSSTPDLHWVAQSTLANSVYSIKTNTTTGDGGWVW